METCEEKLALAVILHAELKIQKIKKKTNATTRGSTQRDPSRQKNPGKEKEIMRKEKRVSEFVEGKRYI